MKKITGMLLVLGLTFSFPTYSQYGATGLGDTSGTKDDDQVATLLTNLGAYLGYDLSKSIAAYGQLFNAAAMVKTGQPLLNVLFATIPVNASYPNFSANSAYSYLNEQANSLFPSFADPTGTGAEDEVTAVEDFDQKDYRSDLVSQSILDLLSTPDNTTCPSSDDTCVNQNEMMYKVLKDVVTDTTKGTLPGSAEYYKTNTNIKFLNQLHIDTLLAPMIYSTTAGSTGAGLPTKTQAQQAADFIRYATGLVIPIETMTKTDYDNLWNTASVNTTTPDDNTIQARKDLMKYLLQLRVYAAQNSVPISNLASIMEKRMPQTVATSSTASSTTSEAFNEFVMATWRLFSPTVDSNSQWIKQIDGASAATVQKEIAILLAEMNYQLYLTRQQQERLLLTNSLILIQSASSNRPNTTSSSSSSASS